MDSITVAWTDRGRSDRQGAQLPLTSGPRGPQVPSCVRHAQCCPRAGLPGSCEAGCLSLAGLDHFLGLLTFPCIHGPSPAFKAPAHPGAQEPWSFLSSRPGGPSPWAYPCPELMERPGPLAGAQGGEGAAVPGPRCPPSCHSALVTGVSEAVRHGDHRPALPVDAPTRPHYVPTSQPQAGDGQACDRTSAPVDKLSPCLEHSLLFPSPPTPTPALQSASSSRKPCPLSRCRTAFTAQTTRATAIDLTGASSSSRLERRRQASLTGRLRVIEHVQHVQLCTGCSL